MEVNNGEWYLNGLDWDDPDCIHTVDELIKVINKIGFLPLFETEGSGFSVENMTDPTKWWCGDEAVDPWEWRAVITRRGDIAYGKFFGKKAGFVSKKWFPVFANYRRDGYDFDSRYEDGKAGYKEKLIMDLFLPKDAEMWEIDPKDPGKYVKFTELYSNEVKDKAGFGKDGEKGFDGVCAKLQMQTYMVVKDFKPRLNKQGESFGWAVAIYTLPEYLWGYEHVSSCYKEKPADSYQKIVRQVSKFYDLDEKTLRKILKG